MLHVGHSGRVDPDAVAHVVRLPRSTSPSSLLLASLDDSRRQLVLHGEQLLHETLEAIEAARAKLATVEGIALVDAALVGRPGRGRVRPAAHGLRRARDRPDMLRDRRRAAPLL